MNFRKTEQLGDEHRKHPDAELEDFIERAHTPISLEELDKLCEGNEFLESLYETMMDYCTRYTEDVFKMKAFSKIPVSERDENWQSEDKKNDRLRHTLHQATMDSINILARNLKEQGRSNEWLRPLDAGGRSAYGRFAISLTFSYYLFLRRKEEHHG